jgi:hypothetical protein
MAAAPLPEGPPARLALLTAAALHTQPLELDWLREPVRTQLSDGAYPQLVLRFGMVIQVAAGVRRPPDDVLSASGSDESQRQP